MHSSTILTPVVALLAMVQYCPAPAFIAPVVAAAAEAGGVSTGTIVGGTVAGVVGTAGTVGGSVAIENDGDNPLRKRSNSRIYQMRGTPDLSGLGLGTAWPDCMNALKSADLKFSRTGNAVTVDGMPATCMTLSTVLTGKFDEGNPTPEGSASIKFSNLSASDVNDIQDALEAHPNYNPSA